MENIFDIHAFLSATECHCIGATLLVKPSLDFRASSSCRPIQMQRYLAFFFAETSTSAANDTLINCGVPIPPCDVMLFRRLHSEQLIEDCMKVISHRKG
jgi:hypothetical protein